MPPSSTREPLVGRQLAFAADVVNPNTAFHSDQVVRLAMEVVLSLALVGFGVWMLATGSGSEEIQKLAAGWIGLVLGYWLK